MQHIKQVWPGGKIISTTQTASSIWYDREIAFHNANSDGDELYMDTFQFPMTFATAEQQDHDSKHIFFN